MAITTNEVQVTWSASNSTSVAGGGTATSDTATVAATAFQAQIELKADHGGTPTAGDIMEFWLLQTLGDPDGTGTNEFETDEQATYLASLDLNADDPARTVVELPVPSAGVQVLAKNNDPDTSVTVSATILEQTG